MFYSLNFMDSILTQESNYMKIRTSSIHGKGAFAAKDIPKGIKIIEYVGEKVTKEEGTTREKLQEEQSSSGGGKTYIFELNEKHDIDGSVDWNSAKFINHSCNPNCEVEIIDDHIWIISSRDIKEGEELYYDYGFDLEDFENYPCKCGAENCIGYMVSKEYWPELKKLLKIN